MKETTAELIGKITGYLFVVVLVVLLIILGPLATIAALNTLFGLQIAYTFWTWLSVAWLHILIAGAARFKSI